MRVRCFRTVYRPAALQQKEAQPVELKLAEHFRRKHLIDGFGRRQVVQLDDKLQKTRLLQRGGLLQFLDEGILQVMRDCSGA